MFTPPSFNFVKGKLLHCLFAELWCRSKVSCLQLLIYHFKIIMCTLAYLQVCVEICHSCLMSYMYSQFLTLVLCRSNTGHLVILITYCLQN
uniref:Uncharacterized protein n=1 Tax=Arundo donax TaxID=35708 RepID=A0A0A9ENL9_ARUDO